MEFTGGLSSQSWGCICFSFCLGGLFLYLKNCSNKHVAFIFCRVHKLPLNVVTCCRRQSVIYTIKGKKQKTETSELYKTRVRSPCSHCVLVRLAKCMASHLPVIFNSFLVRPSLTQCSSCMSATKKVKYSLPGVIIVYLPACLCSCSLVKPLV